MKFIQIFLVILIVIVSGCIGGEDSSSASPFVSGDSGIEFTIENLPPGVRTNEPFSFIVEATNYGGHSASVETVGVSLANTNFFQVILKEDLDQTVTEDNTLVNSIQLFKREADLDRGDVAFFNYDDVVFKLHAFAGDSSALSLQTCYYYQSDGLANICISEDSYGEVCNSIGEKKTFSSAAPVKVRSIAQSNSLKIGPATLANIRSTIQFKLEYVGDGAIYAGSYADGFSCFEGSTSVNTARINSIKVGNILVPEISKACGGSNIVSFDENNQATLTCVINTYEGWTSQLGEFEERLTINLDYIERDVVSKDLSII